MDPDSSPLRVTVTDGRGRPVRDGGLARWLAGLPLPRARGAVSIALVTDRHIRRLNRLYRNRDSATDVLSFPSEGPQVRAGTPVAGQRPAETVRGASGRGQGRPAPRDPRMLGDIAIATGVARRQAREAGHSLSTELRVLALHGLLHLLGYDHEDPGDRGRMARIESRIRREGGLPDGLIGRAAAGSRAGRRSGRRTGTPGAATRGPRVRPTGLRSRSQKR